MLVFDWLIFNFISSEMKKWPGETFRPEKNDFRHASVPQHRALAANSIPSHQINNISRRFGN